jgi:hypothetical protein
MSNAAILSIAKAAIMLAGTISVLGGFIWSIWVVRVFRRDKRRGRLGLCLRCGYDLSHSIDRCPECGDPIRRQPQDKPRAK